MSQKQGEIAWPSIKEHVNRLEKKSATALLILAYIGVPLCRQLIKSSLNKNPSLATGSQTQDTSASLPKTEQDAALPLVKDIPSIRPDLLNAVLSYAYISDLTIKSRIEQELAQAPQIAAQSMLAEALLSLHAAGDRPEVLRMANVCRHMVEMQHEAHAKEKGGYEDWKRLLWACYEILLGVYEKALLPDVERLREFGGVVEAIRGVLFEVLENRFDRGARQRLGKEGFREMLMECDDILPRVPVGETLEYLMD